MITKTLTEWRDVLLRTGIKFEETYDNNDYKVLSFYLNSDEENDYQIIVKFDPYNSNLFTSILYEKAPYRHIEDLRSETLLSDWKNLLQHSGIRHTLREFKTSKFQFNWVEFVCFDKNNSGAVAVEIAYNVKTFQVFDVSSANINGEYNV